MAAPSEHRFWLAFERGFSTSTSGCLRQCVCGRIFYNPTGGWDWEPGELDALEKNPQATSVDWSCGEIRIDGATYALDCTCWHERGLKILKWVLQHDSEVAAFLTEVKTQKTAEAARAPVVT